MRKALISSACWWLGLFGATLAHVDSWADAPALQPYVATYAVSYRGIEAGTISMQLTHDAGTNRYTFETRANPSVLARLVIGRDAVERTIVEPTGEGIRPVQWHLEDGKDGKDGDGDLKFDWSSNKVTGEYEGKPVDLPTQPGLQDRLSIQLAVTAALVKGQEPTSIVMVNGDRTREYNYTRGASAQLDTKLGKQDTIIYESTRPNSNRVSKVWHAPQLQFLPVRAEQIRKGKVETVMQLVALERK
jgi:Protein of unknown function (DUF3108)